MGLYLLASVPLALLGLVHAVVVLVAAPTLGVSVVGLPLLGLGVVLARGPARLQRSLVGGLLHDSVPAPSRFRPDSGLRRWTSAAVADATGWRVLVYDVARAPIVLLGGAVALGAAAGALLVATHPLWRNLAGGAVGSHLPDIADDWESGPWPHSAGLILVAVVVLALVPQLVRLLVAGDLALVRALLTPTVADAASQASRRRADARAAVRLRRITLAPTASDLALALESEGTEDGHGLSCDPSPPLALSLAALTEGTAIPVRLQLNLNRADLGQGVEEVVRLGAEELVGNLVHSGAGVAEVSAVAGPHSFLLRVSDDGHGGAVTRPGGGLERISACLVGMDGLLVISSPAGGPTDVTLAIPLTPAADADLGAARGREPQPGG